MKFNGALLQARREAAGLNMSQLGQAAGVTGQTIRNLEAGNSQPSTPTLLALAEALEVGPMDLLSDNGKT